MVPHVSDPVLVSLITGAFGILALIITNIMALVQNKKTSAKVEVVREQVQNSHGTNLRDDVDKVMAATASIAAAQVQTDNNLAEVKQDVRDLRGDLVLQKQHDLENTKNRREERREESRRFQLLEDTLRHLKEKGLIP